MEQQRLLISLSLMILSVCQIQLVGRSEQALWLPWSYK